MPDVRGRMTEAGEQNPVLLTVLSAERRKAKGGGRRADGGWRMAEFLPLTCDLPSSVSGS